MPLASCLYTFSKPQFGNFRVLELHRQVSSLMKSNINAILIIHSSGVGGVEKRFFNLFQHIRFKGSNSNTRYTFYFNRRFLARINVRKIGFQNQTVRAVVYGISERLEKRLLINKFVRLLDFLHLGLLLIESKLLRRVDVVHFVTTSSLRYRFIFLKQKKVTSFYNGAYTRNGIKDRIYRNAFKEDIYFDCLSSDISRILINEGNVPTDKVFTSPCSFTDLDGTFFDPKLKDKIVSFVGRLDEQKGIRILLKSIVSVVGIVQDVKFFIVGYGPLDGEIRSFINEHDLQNNVFLFFHPNPKEVLIKSLIFLSLQKTENYPSQSLLEAMVCGNAIIATDVGLTKLLVDESNGTLIRETEEELTSAIIALLNSKEDTLSKCLNSRQKVLAAHTADRFLTYLNDLYNRRLNA